MHEKVSSYSAAAKQLGPAVRHGSLDASEIKLIKQQVQDSYNCWAHMVYNKAFLNWGLWDRKIYAEYEALPFTFSDICPVQDVCAQTLLYYLIRPLVNRSFFNKRLLDIGCGNGIGLKVSSELLKSNYALGIDLVHKLVTNASGNFYKNEEVNYIQSDAETLPLLDESFDLISNLESSHLYPNLEYFFSEVERVLAPGGFFCYADIHVKDKQQIKRFEAFIKTKKKLTIVLKHDITKMVQASIYRRLIANEENFYNHAKSLFGGDENKEKFLVELSALANAMGLTFLPWWQIWFKNPDLYSIAKQARKSKYWGKKCFYYYLVQKDDK